MLSLLMKCKSLFKLCQRFTELPPLGGRVLRNVPGEQGVPSARALVSGGFPLPQAGHCTAGYSSTERLSPGLLGFQHCESYRPRQSASAGKDRDGHWFASASTSPSHPISLAGCEYVPGECLH